MSRKRGETKMVDVARAVADVAEYDRIAATVPSNVIKEFADALGVSATVAVTAQPRARSRTFVARPCSVCQALREPNTNYTRVYATRETARYCKCDYCGNTWKDLEKT